MPKTDLPDAVLHPVLDPVVAPGAFVVVQDEVIQLHEETIRIEKRLVETDRAQIRIGVTEHDETVESLLMHQDMVIDRVAIGTRVDAVPPVRREGDTVIVPVMEEIMVVEKHLVLKEELHIRIDVTKRAETQVVRLRREHAEIDRGDAVAVSPKL